MGGYNSCGLNCIISKTYNIRSHSFIKMDYYFGRIDTWSNEYFTMKIDGNEKHKMTYSVEGS